MSKMKSVPGLPRASATTTSRRGETPRPGQRYRQTPALGTGRAVSDGAAAWMKPARRMVQMLEEALGTGNPDAATVASIERAWAAWEMARTSPAVASRVAHLVDRAYVAMHEGPSPQSEEALKGCAHILYNGLPASVRKTTDFPKVIELVRKLERERQLWTAVVRTTSELLGWTGIALSYAGHALRVAMAVEAEPLA